VTSQPKTLFLKLVLPLAVFAAVLLMPTPEGLTVEGQRALAVMALAVVLWATEALPIAVTGIVGVVLLVLVNAVPDVEAALFGFSQPVPYFLIGILTLGLAVQRSGLAERMAVYMIRLAGGSSRALYGQMLFSFAALTFALPSASTRGAIMVHVYEQVMTHWRVPQEAPLHKAIMMAMGALNRLGSTALLAGGITPIVASSLIGELTGEGFSWTRWFVLMALPLYSVLLVGGAVVYVAYRSGFRLENVVDVSSMTTGPLRLPEIKAALIALGTALLWFTDFAHGLAPTVPALIAMAIILLPGIGLLTWEDLERDLGWSNFFVIATSLSLANAIIASGAAAWFADTMVGSVEGLRGSPTLVLLAIAGASSVVRMLMPNISGYLAFIIPVAMSTGASLGLNPLVVGLAVVIVGDSVVFYPAGGAASVFIFQRANLRSPEIFRLGLIMTVVAIAVLFAIVLPYWRLVGESLTG
jgi:anion transporter